MKVPVAYIVYNKKEFLHHERVSPVVTGVLALCRVRGFGLRNLENVLQLRNCIVFEAQRAEGKLKEVIKKYGKRYGDGYRISNDCDGFLDASQEVNTLLSEEVEAPDRFKLPKCKVYGADVTPEEILALTPFVEIVDEDI